MNSVGIVLVLLSLGKFKLYIIFIMPLIFKSVLSISRNNCLNSFIFCM